VLAAEKERFMKFADVTPNLVVSTIDRSLAFYRDVLGFSVVTTVPEQAPFAFVWMQRDTVNVFLNSEASTGMTASPGTNILFITLEPGDIAAGIDALFAAVKDRAPVEMPVTDQFYGMREFTITDPDGYVVTFAQPNR
jgi:lactoylglutathione lyase